MQELGEEAAGVQHVGASYNLIHKFRPVKCYLMRPANLIKAVLDDTTVYVAKLETARSQVEVPHLNM